jgi:hypothetical protein
MNDDLTVRRIAENQSRFREANEKIEVAAERLGILDPVPFICECSRQDCTRLLRLTLDEYEEIRQYPQRFFTAPGHQDIAVETGAGTAVEATDGHVVVDKVGEAGEIAREEYRELSESPPGNS